jgi:hypothetical protein
MAKVCERHARRRCAECGQDTPWWGWALLEGLGQFVVAVIEGLADADWGDD